MCKKYNLHNVQDVEQTDFLWSWPGRSTGRSGNLYTAGNRYPVYKVGATRIAACMYKYTYTNTDKVKHKIKNYSDEPV